jgi:GGDEF domain-containing protein
MGLRNRALRFREQGQENNDIEKIFSIYTGDSGQFNGLKNSIEKYFNSLKAELDHKLLDMQTILEIGKEINSTLHLQELMQIIIFTMMGQFRVSDVAVFSISGSIARLIEKKGFAGLDSIPVENSFDLFLNNSNGTLPLDKIREFSDGFRLLNENNAGLIVPVKNREKLTGVIVLGKKTGGEDYTADESAFIFTIASLSGIAIENARLYGVLEKKLGELSSLYEISKVINSSDDYQSVLALINETITTGFGVRKAVLLSFEENGPAVSKVIGLPENLIGSQLELNPQEENMFLLNCAGILNVPSRLPELGVKEENYLFMPLVSSGTKIGAILIFSFENYSIEPDNLELINLFSIIASQIAPPLALTKQLGINRDKSVKPFESVLELIGREIDKARKYGVAIHLMMLKFSNISKYIKKAGDQDASGKLALVRDRISAFLPNTASVLRYGTARLLLILPEVFDNDLNELKNSITRLTREIFANSDRINIGAEISMVDCSDEKNGLLTLLNQIE